MTTNPPSDEDVQGIMSLIRGKTALIVNVQRTADTEGFSCMGGALGLQQLQIDRRVLQAQLPPLRLVS